MKVKLVYFAWVRERIGKSEEERELPEHLATVGDVAAWLATLGPEYEAAFASRGAIRAAIDRAHAKPEAPIAGAREIAFFPPVTGG